MPSTTSTKLTSSRSGATISPTTTTAKDGAAATTTTASSQKKEANIVDVLWCAPRPPYTLYDPTRPVFEFLLNAESSAVNVTILRNARSVGNYGGHVSTSDSECFKTNLTARLYPIAESFASRNRDNKPARDAARRLTYFSGCKEQTWESLWSKSLQTIDGPESDTSFDSYAFFDPTQSEVKNPCSHFDPGPVHNVIHFTINEPSTEPFIVASFNDGVTNARQSPHTTLTTETLWATATQAAPVTLTLGGDVSMNKVLSLSQGAGDLLAGTSLLLVGAGALVWAAKRALSARRQKPVAAAEGNV